jgi:ArsR family transcriptional regulator
MTSKKDWLLFDSQAQIIKAMSHPLRIAIIHFLEGKEQCVCDIAEHLGSKQSNVSRHLSVMAGAGLLEYHKEGLKVIYKLRTPCILDFFSCINTCLKQNLKAGEKLLEVL